MQYFARFLSPGIAETDNRWVGKLNSQWPVVSEIYLPKLIKIGSLFFRLWWKKFGVFLCLTVYNYNTVYNHVSLVVICDNLIVGKVEKTILGRNKAALHSWVSCNKAGTLGLRVWWYRCCSGCCGKMAVVVTCGVFEVGRQLTLLPFEDTPHASWYAFYPNIQSLTFVQFHGGVGPIVNDLPNLLAFCFEHFSVRCSEPFCHRRSAVESWIAEKKVTIFWHTAANFRQKRIMVHQNLNFFFEFPPTYLTIFNFSARSFAFLKKKLTKI